MRRGMTNRNQFGMVGSRKSSKRESEKLGNQRKNEYDVVEKNTVFNHMRNYVFFARTHRHQLLGLEAIPLA